MSPEQLERAKAALREIRDALAAITNAGPDMPTQAIRSVAWLCAQRADQALTELTQ